MKYNYRLTDATGAVRKEGTTDSNTLHEAECLLVSACPAGTIYLGTEAVPRTESTYLGSYCYPGADSDLDNVSLWVEFAIAE